MQAFEESVEGVVDAGRAGDGRPRHAERGEPAHLVDDLLRALGYEGGRQDGVVRSDAPLDDRDVHVEGAVVPELGSGRPVIVLVQDSPGLNNLDFGVSLESSMHEAVELQLGEFHRVLENGVADFMPHMVYVDEPVTVVGQSVSAGGLRFRSYYLGSVRGAGEDDDKEEPEVYVLLAR